MPTTIHNSYGSKGLDVSSWVYDGIPYLSKAQEATTKKQGKNSTTLGTYLTLPNQNSYSANIIHGKG